MNVIVNLVRFVDWPDMDINYYYLIKSQYNGWPRLAVLADSRNDTVIFDS